MAVFGSGPRQGAMFEKILIANRGEIALRIQRACRELGIKTVAVHSEADADAKYVMLADESVCIGPAPSKDSYLNIPAIISAAEVTDAQAIHPGYGFLSENADFAERVENSGFVFHRPAAGKYPHHGRQGCRQGGDEKSRHSLRTGFGRRAAGRPEGNPQDCRRSRLPGHHQGGGGGGGGRGMRVVHTEAALVNAVQMTKTEAQSAFGNPMVYLEKFLENPRHIEIQVLADEHKNALFLWERDCSMQRRHQKITEEAPAPELKPRLRDRIGERCAEACLKLGYRGAGTFEFLYEKDEFYFIEMNTRVQVEHPVSEMITGIDIVQEQVRIAAGQKLRYRQKDIQLRGHSPSNAASTRKIRCRSCRRPAALRVFMCRGDPGIRVDSHVYADYFVPPYYDSLIAKVIAHGDTREQAFARMRTALSEMVVEGIQTNLPLHQELMNDAAFIRGGTSIHFLEERMAKLKKIAGEAD